MKKGIVLMMVNLAGMVLAEDVESASAMTIKDIVVRGGGIMYVIVGLSILALILIVFYMLTMRARLLYPPQLMMDCQTAAENGDLKTLKELCDGDNCAAAKIIGSAVERSTQIQNLDVNEMRQAMEDEGSRQVGQLWQRLQYLMDIAVISPMVGLLGTVWGMMVSFSGLESGLNFINKADALANGVSQAMFTTFGGLIVGIMSMSCYALLRGHVTRLASGLENSCSAVLRALTAKK